jgi:hypothetical protein
VLAADGVASVFGVNDFVTVMREPGADWDAIVCVVQEAAAEHLRDGPVAAPDRDPVAQARDLLRDAVVPQKPTAVEIRRRKRDDPNPGTEH